MNEPILIDLSDVQYGGTDLTGSFTVEARAFGSKTDFRLPRDKALVADRMIQSDLAFHMLDKGQVATVLAYIGALQPFGLDKKVLAVKGLAARIAEALVEKKAKNALLIFIRNLNVKDTKEEKMDALCVSGVLGCVLGNTCPEGFFTYDSNEIGDLTTDEFLKVCDAPGAKEALKKAHAGFEIINFANLQNHSDQVKILTVPGIVKILLEDGQAGNVISMLSEWGAKDQVKFLTTPELAIRLEDALESRRHARGETSHLKSTIAYLSEDNQKAVYDAVGSGAFERLMGPPLWRDEKGQPHFDQRIPSPQPC